MRKLLPLLLALCSCHRHAPVAPQVPTSPEEEWDLLVRGNGEGLYKDLTVALDEGFSLPPGTEEAVRNRAGVRLRAVPLSLKPRLPILALRKNLDVDLVRAHLLAGGKAYIDECGEEIDALARQLLGEPADVPADHPLLRGLGKLPPSHSSDDPTLRGVSRDGVRLLRSRDEGGGVGGGGRSEVIRSSAIPAARL
ncbi:MAG: hypothetical protein HYY17_17330 [Planctomycetes bacterium]|nr:hypothetical protein [Planctomycetota bacterium]